MFKPPKDIASLDGLRAISVAIVLVSHAGLGSIVPGGLGVTIFFFLSGYLITTLLRAEVDRTGTINIGHFYLRRFLRLAPPLLITLAIGYGAVLAGLHPGGVTLEGLFAQVFYFANYYQLFFDPGQTTPQGTGVLWSLAVEEHFYLVFPFVFLWLSRRWPASRVALVCVAVCALVLLWRLYLVSQPGFFVERTFYATDTRIDSILWGCVLALTFNPAVATGPDRPTAGHWTLLAAALGLMLASLLIRDVGFRESVRYTVQGLALLPVFYFAVRFPTTWLMRPLNWGWMKTLGVYSYAIYLIHHVVIANLRVHFDWAQHIAPLIVATVLISVAYAAAIERFVESRLRVVRSRLR